MKLSRKQSKVWRYLSPQSKKKEVFFGGGSGSGKSILGCLWQIHRRLEHPGTSGLMARNVLKDLKDTTLETFFEVANEMGVENEFTYKEQKSRIVFKNGSLIYLRELRYKPSDPDFQDLGSLNIADAFVDESTEITKKAKTYLLTRIRHKLVNKTPKLLLTGNPSANWARDEYIGKIDQPVKLKDHQAVVLATILDNPDKEFVKVYKENLQSLPLYERLRLLNGEWFARDDSLSYFFLEFNRAKHAIEEYYLPDDTLPLWLSFDFNIDPCTAIVAQKDDFNSTATIYDVHQVNGGTEALCNEIVDLYKHYDLMVTGDFSGATRSSKSGNTTDWSIIQDKFDLNTWQMTLTHKQNERHLLSRKVVNYFLKHADFAICNTKGTQALINDLEGGIVKPDGKLLKDRSQHKQDAGDAFRYLVHAWFPQMIGSGTSIEKINEFVRMAV